jgi:hypothetical protein
MLLKIPATRTLRGALICVALIVKILSCNKKKNLMVYDQNYFYCSTLEQYTFKFCSTNSTLPDRKWLVKIISTMSWSTIKITSIVLLSLAVKFSSQPHHLNPFICSFREVVALITTNSSGSDFHISECCSWWEGIGQKIMAISQI